MVTVHKDRFDNVNDTRLFGAPTPDAARELFSTEAMLRHHLVPFEHDLEIALGLSKEQRLARHQGLAALTRQTKLDPGLIGRIYAKHTEREIRIRRAGADVVSEEDQATMQARFEEAGVAVKGRYGDRGPALLAQAKRFVANHPGLAKMLDGPLGSDREVVLALVDHMNQINTRG